VESKIEKAVNTYARKRGWLTYKWSSANCRGVPDRIYIRDGVIIMVEYKSPGRKLTPLQAYVHQQLTDAGCTVYVINNIDNGKLLFA
jgi:hypothetical protein